MENARMLQGNQQVDMKKIGKYIILFQKHRTREVLRIKQM